MNQRLYVDWLRFIRTPGLNRSLINRLIDHFGTPEALLDASAKELQAVPGATPQLAETILKGHHKPHPGLSPPDELAALAQLGGKALILGGPDYPPLLATIHDPPPILFVLGDDTLLTGKNKVAIVGTRKASHGGLQLARKMGADLSGHGLITVSGLAMGIDTAAHWGALEGGGQTIAVIATGLDIDYPHANAELRRRIIEKGCLITESPLGTPALPHLFPPRNRIISGLSLGVAVVEASMKSGSLITARLALEQGREVFAVPGPVTDSRSKGVHHLLKQGACLVENVADIIQELELSWSDSLPNNHGERLDTGAHLSKASPRTSPEERPDTPPNQAQNPPSASAIPPPQSGSEAWLIVEQLKKGPHLADELARSCGLTVASLSRILLQLELVGVVQRLPGNTFTLGKHLE
ncbi:MAG: DNA-protecting protein DprA [Magnetococcales bacterium]|nr:DNA-protecting protein DprA [Magnetococcales bacterium]